MASATRTDEVGLEENHVANPVLKEVLGGHLSQRSLTELTDGADLQIQVWIFTESVPQLEALAKPRPCQPC